MKYQLALQFPGRSGTDYDKMIALEAALTAALGEEAEMDGHDVGTDAMNLYIVTDDPDTTVARVISLLERHELLEWVTAACRHLDEDHYTVIWPPHGPKEFKLG